MRREKERDCSAIIKTKKPSELKSDASFSSFGNALLWSSGDFVSKSRLIVFEI